MRFTFLPTLDRLARDEGTRLRRAVLRWLRRHDPRYGRFWATSGDDMRALFAECATIQHYVREDEASFLESLRLARSFRGSEPGSPTMTGLLLDILEANQLVRKGDIEAAVSRYRRRIRQEEATYRAMLRRRQPDVRRELSQQRGLLGLLELNLTELLRGESTGFEEMEARYRRCSNYIPDSTFIKTSYAEFLVSQRRWEQAVEKFKEAYAERGLDNTSTDLNVHLAWVYRSWARWLNQPVEQAKRPEVSNIASTRIGRKTLAAFRTLFTRTAGRATPTAASALPRRLEARHRLEEALSTLKWKDIPGWEASLHFERASILEFENMAANAKDAYEAFLKSAQLYSNARDALNSSYAFARAGDVLVQRGLVAEAIAMYENGLRQAESIGVKNDGREWQRRNTIDTLLSKLAISQLGLGDQPAAQRHFARLAEQWWGAAARPGGASWGPYHDAQSLGELLLTRTELRYPLTAYYHRLLANEPSFKDARDLTAAMLALYRFARPRLEDHTDEAVVLGGASGSDEPMNVVTPLAIEISSALLDILDKKDLAIHRSLGFVLDDLRDLASLAGELKDPKRPVDEYLAGQLSPEAQVTLANYESFVSDPRPLRAALLEMLDKIVKGSSIYDARRFEGISLREPTESLLARAPKKDDLARLNTWLLEDAYPAQLLRSAIGRYAGAMRRRIAEEFGVLIPGVRVRSSDELTRNDYRLLLNELIVGEGACSDERLEPVFLHLEVTIAANLPEFVGHQETQNYLERNKLVIPTVEDISEKEHYSHIDPLTAVLRALLAERVPLSKPKEIYEVFRAEWKQGTTISAIVERIRQIPSVRARLWGNDGKHAYVFLPSSIENILVGATRTADQSDYLVMKERERTAILAAVGEAINGLQRPALIVRGQKQRALMRQLIASKYPEIPVLSASDLLRGAKQIAQNPEINRQKIES